MLDPWYQIRARTAYAHNFITHAIVHQVETVSLITKVPKRARWLSGRALDSGAKGPGFDPTV